MPKKKVTDTLLPLFLDPVTRWMFFDFAAKEFSLENALSYWLILQFKENPSRLRARILFAMFFKGKDADFEINCAKSKCTDADNAIKAEADESKKLSPGYSRIFDKLLSDIQINLSDTYSRLYLNEEFIAYTTNRTGDKLLRKIRPKIEDALGKLESLDMNLGIALGGYKDLDRDVVELEVDGKPVITYDGMEEKPKMIKGWEALANRSDRRIGIFANKLTGGLKIFNQIEKDAKRVIQERTDIAGWSTQEVEPKMKHWIPQLKKAGFDLTGLGIPKMLLKWGPPGK